MSETLKLPITALPTRSTKPKLQDLLIKLAISEDEVSKYTYSLFTNYLIPLADKVYGGCLNCESSLKVLEPDKDSYPRLYELWKKITSLNERDQIKVWRAVIKYDTENIFNFEEKFFQITENMEYQSLLNVYYSYYEEFLLDLLGLSKLALKEKNVEHLLTRYEFIELTLGIHGLKVIDILTFIRLLLFVPIAEVILGRFKASTLKYMMPDITWITYKGIIRGTEKDKALANYYTNFLFPLVESIGDSDF